MTVVFESIRISVALVVKLIRLCMNTSQSSYRKKRAQKVIITKCGSNSMHIHVHVIIGMKQ